MRSFASAQTRNYSPTKRLRLGPSWTARPVIKRFHAMTGDIQASLGGPNNDRVKALFAAIRGQLATKDFAGANKNIDALAPLVKPAQAAGPKDNGSAVIKRFHAMTGDIQASLGGPNNDRVKSLFAAIRDQLAAKDFAGANKNIDVLAPLVKPAQPAAGPKDNGAAVIKRFHAMTGDIQASLGGPNNDRVKSLFAAIRDQLVAKDFAGANKNIDALAPLVKSAKAAPAPQPAGLGAKLTNRLSTMSADIKAAMAGPNQASVKSLLARIGGQIKTKDFLLAVKGFRELESLLGKTTPAPLAAAPQPSRLGAKLTQRLNGMSAELKAAMAGPYQSGVKAKLLAINGQIKNKDFLLAIKSLRDLESLVGQSAALASSQQGAAELIGRLKPMTANIKSAPGWPGSSARKITARRSGRPDQKQKLHRRQSVARRIAAAGLAGNLNVPRIKSCRRSSTRCTNGSASRRPNSRRTPIGCWRSPLLRAIPM